ncbi:hypothetical protein AAVH_29021 [Aphelenchoides avenae]|nr:hypothetical protein AAVH_29021 [Aphelenchus avenae]
MPFACTSVHGLSRYFGTDGARLSMAAAVFFDVMVVGGQTYCILYRTCLIYGYRDASDVLSRLLCVTIASLFTVVIGIALSRLIYNCFTSDEEMSCYLLWTKFGTPLADDSVMYCIVLGIRRLKKGATNFSEKTRAMHLQLPKLLLAQIVSPMICLFIPIVAFISSEIATLRTGFLWSNLPVELAILCFTAFPLVNAILAITFIGPYRRFTASWLSMEEELRAYTECLDLRISPPVDYTDFIRTIPLYDDSRQC